MASIKIFSLFVAIALQGQAVLGQSCASKDFSQSVCGLVTFEGSKPVKFEVQLAEVDSSGQFSCDQQLTKMCCATDFKLGQTAKTQLVSVDLANFGTTCSTTTLKT
ncbi:hypothetical protein MJO28_004835 [Puccinia striiformis f. sp. tritici]|uniref:Hydrophobin n=2 Tax=Puccinia striiformis f. sp. tritici TaxID=168172 RepID=A0A0L0VF08_9BASI|nr:hypothetical protein Pst134EA_009058 [Puccinia striiformis f. sp. tritici]KAI9609540.1 hypothetical protein H4Q26_007497 [Puccinia striiformis f. sp. tritici PST-130]KNE97786.1 hypothetical protein PSTG_09006 [Puccinia striiformis f. sp. tritici PST-78]KAH9457765.1 hypothetical protein Pst134EB_010080 [Puccinia striiformis f. sp. tritici]KAH9468517.1 hypothetical protein Pst134EA_009058 [Puccinia striiformis f. sp. tritici]KAI7954435.1 hypothetical protein MJO28_004835 [Puccinia striiformis